LQKGVCQVTWLHEEVPSKKREEVGEKRRREIRGNFVRRARQEGKVNREKGRNRTGKKKPEGECLSKKKPKGPNGT